MKSFAQLREQMSLTAKPIDEMAAFNDPPTVLVLRRKAIRLFPGGQRVASYVNDNLDLEIAIPYNPETLGHKKITTSVAAEETQLTEPFNKGDLLIQIDERFNPGDKVEIHRMYGLQLTNPILGRVKRAIGDGLYHVETAHTAVTVAHGLAFPKGKHNTHEHNMRIVEQLEEATSDNLFGMYLKHHKAPIHFNDRNFKPLKKIEAVVSQRYGAPALKHFQMAAAHHQDGDLDKANHHYAKYKAAASHLGESLDEETGGGTDDIMLEGIKGWKHAHSDLARYRREAGNATKSVKLVSLKKDGTESKMHDAATYHSDEAAARAHHENLVKLNPNRKVAHNMYVDGKHHSVLGEALDEATIHSLHTITRTKTPAVVRFRNHATAMVHHETAAQVMKLHSMMKAANKRKIEALINGSPEGLKKVHDFALAHMKG